MNPSRCSSVTISDERDGPSSVKSAISTQDKHEVNSKIQPAKSSSGFTPVPSLQTSVGLVESSAGSSNHFEDLDGWGIFPLEPIFERSLRTHKKIRLDQPPADYDPHHDISPQETLMVNWDQIMTNPNRGSLKAPALKPVKLNIFFKQEGRLSESERENETSSRIPRILHSHSKVTPTRLQFDPQIFRFSPDGMGLQLKIIQRMKSSLTGQLVIDEDDPIEANRIFEELITAVQIPLSRKRENDYDSRDPFQNRPVVSQDVFFEKKDLWFSYWERRAGGLILMERLKGKNLRKGFERVLLCYLFYVEMIDQLIKPRVQNDSLKVGGNLIRSAWEEFRQQVGQKGDLFMSQMKSSRLDLNIATMWKFLVHWIRVSKRENLIKILIDPLSGNVDRSPKLIFDFIFTHSMVEFTRRLEFSD